MLPSVTTEFCLRTPPLFKDDVGGICFDVQVDGSRRKLNFGKRSTYTLPVQISVNVTNVARVSGHRSC